MSRHLQYLNCLRDKLKARYGDDDDAVREVEHAVSALEEVEARYRGSPALDAMRSATETKPNFVAPLRLPQ